MGEIEAVRQGLPASEGQLVFLRKMGEKGSFHSGLARRRADRGGVRAVGDELRTLDGYPLAGIGGRMICQPRHFFPSWVRFDSQRCFIVDYQVDALLFPQGERFEWAEETCFVNGFELSYHGTPSVTLTRTPGRWGNLRCW